MALGARLQGRELGPRSRRLPVKHRMRRGSWRLIKAKIANLGTRVVLKNILGSEAEKSIF